MDAARLIKQLSQTGVPVILQPAHATTTLNNPMQPSRCNPMQPHATPMQPSCNPSATLAINLCILIGNPRSAIRRINSCMSRTRGHVARCNPGSTDPDSDATIVAGYSIRCNPLPPNATLTLCNPMRLYAARGDFYATRYDFMQPDATLISVNWGYCILNFERFS